MRKFLFCSLTFLLFFIAFALIVYPERYIKACYEGVTLWGISVMPSLLPFFFLSLLITNLGITANLSNKLSKPTAFLYNVNGVASFVQLMSFISGYPVGAKLIAELYKERIITSEEGSKISVFTSTSGPMFVIGSVGIGMFSSKKAGIILLVSHLLSAIVNGVIFRKVGAKNDKRSLKKLTVNPYKGNILYDCAYGATLSCLIVGAFIAVFYVFSNIVNDFNLLAPFNALFTFIFGDKEKARAFCAGLIECTNGCILFAKTKGSLTLPLTSFIISFGGLSILFQSVAFLKEANVNVKFFILGKITQAIISFIICYILSLLFYR